MLCLLCRSDSVVAEIALGGLEKEDKELHQLDRAVFSKVCNSIPAVSVIAFYPMLRWKALPLRLLFEGVDSVLC